MKGSSRQHYTVSPPPLSAGAGQLSGPNFEKEGDQENNECLGGGGYLIVPTTDICKGVYNISRQKNLCKIKYGSEGSVFIADLGLLASTN